MPDNLATNLKGKRSAQASTARYVKKCVDQMQDMQEATYKLVVEVSKQQSENRQQVIKLVTAIAGDAEYGHTGLIKEVHDSKEQLNLIAKTVEDLAPRTKALENNTKALEDDQKKIKTDLSALKIDRRVVLKVVSILTMVIVAAAAVIEAAAWAFDHLKQLFWVAK